METDNIEQQEQPINILDESKESVEVSKNAKGFYAYKIKLKEEAITVQTIERLEILTKQMEAKYG